MIRRPPRSTHCISSAASDVYKRQLFTCTVGRKPSHASYYVNDYKDVLMLLSSMVSCSIKIPRNKSVDDLAKFGIKRTNVHVSPIASKSKRKELN
eukprot:TRINITY_DN1286_c0_g1_i12.p1 TRINITY_DN1286_c0_g1~~TRINITY_DN1286_c0_g1_i12.p1  ORF type:complete len:102 (+),score=30.49 TRINITY_DN1286_c0_g1_i12:24-308(+)